MLLKCLLVHSLFLHFAAFFLISFHVQISLFLHSVVEFSILRSLLSTFFFNHRQFLSYSLTHFVFHWCANQQRFASIPQDHENIFSICLISGIEVHAVFIDYLMHLSIFYCAKVSSWLCFNHYSYFHSNCNLVCFHFFSIISQISLNAICKCS